MASPDFRFRDGFYPKTKGFCWEGACTAPAWHARLIIRLIKTIKVNVDLH